MYWSKGGCDCTPSLLTPFRRCAGLSIRSVICVHWQWTVPHRTQQITVSDLYVILLDAGIDRLLDVPLLSDTDLVSMQMSFHISGSIWSINFIISYKSASLARKLRHYSWTLTLRSSNTLSMVVRLKFILAKLPQCLLQYRKYFTIWSVQKGTIWHVYKLLLQSTG